MADAGIIAAYKRRLENQRIAALKHRINLLQQQPETQKVLEETQIDILLDSEQGCVLEEARSPNLSMREAGEADFQHNLEEERRIDQLIQEDDKWWDFEEESRLDRLMQEADEAEERRILEEERQIDRLIQEADESDEERLDHLMREVDEAEKRRIFEEEHRLELLVREVDEIDE